MFTLWYLYFKLSNKSKYFHHCHPPTMTIFFPLGPSSFTLSFCWERSGYLKMWPSASTPEPARSRSLFVAHQPVRQGRKGAIFFFFAGKLYCRYIYTTINRCIAIGWVLATAAQVRFQPLLHVSPHFLSHFSRLIKEKKPEKQIFKKHIRLQQLDLFSFSADSLPKQTRWLSCFVCYGSLDAVNSSATVTNPRHTSDKWLRLDSKHFPGESLSCLFSL